MSLTKTLSDYVFQKCIAPLCFLIAVVATVLLFAATPQVWEKLYEAPEGLSESAQSDGVTIARHLWTDKSYGEVSGLLKGGSLLKPEIEHYEDLQEKFTQLTVLSLFTIMISGLCFLRRDVQKILVFSLIWLVVLSVIFTAWAVYDWRHFFRTLHWWLFQDDSWILPNDCYSLRLYPYSVWKKAMLWMSYTSFAIYATLLILAVIRVRFRQWFSPVK